MAGATHTTTVGSKLAGMSIQTSLLGQVIPIGWGRGKLSCNLIDYLNWTPIPHTTTTKTSSGKGGSSTTSDTEYTYTADVIMAICDAGPSGIIGVNTVWKDSAKFTGSTSLAQAGLSAQLGTSTQTPWSYLTTAAPTHALAYRNVAYVYAQAYDLGTSGVVANHSFEVDFATQFNHAGGIYDANPPDILTDFLTNVDHGVSGWPSGILGDWTNWSNYCVANGLFLSPVLDQPTQGSSFVQRLMDETHSDCFFSEGLFKVVPLGDASVTGNGVTFTPNLTPILDLNEDDFGVEISLEIIDQSDAYNRVQIQYLDRSNEYNQAVTVTDDLDNIVQFGLRLQDPQSFEDICDAGVARTVAQLWLQRQLYIRDRYKVENVPEDAAVYLEQRDYITLTSTKDGLNLQQQLVSILSIDETEDGTNTFTIVAEGIPGHTGSAATYATHVATGFAPDVNVDPGNIATPFIFNLPNSLSTSVTTLEVAAAVAGTNVNWGGCFVWVSFDGTDYSRIGQIKGPATYGVLSASLASHADPDSTNTLSVDLTTSKGSLGSVSTTAADQDVTLCLIKTGSGFELVSYATSTLTSAYHYDLTYLRRGQLGSAIGAHSSSDNFVRLDNAIFTMPFDVTKLGQTVHVKFQSYNAYGRAVQDLSTVTDYTIVLAKAGAGPDMPTNLRLANGGSTWTGPNLDVVCDPANRATSYKFDFYKSDGTTLVRSITNASPSASYTTKMAFIDGALREYKIAVTATNDSGSSLTTSQIDVTNAAPAALTSPSATSGATTASVTATASSDTDSPGYIVFYSATSGFNPATAGGVVTSGTLPVYIYGLGAGTWYCKIAAFDPWTADPSQLNLSTELSFSITTGGGSSPSGGGDTGGWDGNCVVETALILMADETLTGPGARKPAYSCEVGDYVWTRPEEALDTWGAYKITAIEFVDAFTYCAPGYPDATPKHRFYLDWRGWFRMESLGIPLGMRKVAKITVEEAHTYIANGILSHNLKDLP